MRGRRWLVISVLVGALVALSGCVSGPGTNATVTVAPLPTLEPTFSPVPTLVPGETGHDTIGVTKGNQVRVRNVSVAYARTDYLQAENFTVTFENVGDTAAENVGFNLKETDPQTGEVYYTKVFLLGTLPANGTADYKVTTSTHDYLFSVIVNIHVYWGENVEFSNTYKNAFTLVFIPTD